MGYRRWDYFYRKTAMVGGAAGIMSVLLSWKLQAQVRYHGQEVAEICMGSYITARKRLVVAFRWRSCFLSRGAPCVEVLATPQGRHQRIEVQDLVGRIARWTISLQWLSRFAVASLTSKMLCARMKKYMLNPKGKARVCI